MKLPGGHTAGFLPVAPGADHVEVRLRYDGPTRSRTWRPVQAERVVKVRARGMSGFGWELFDYATDEAIRDVDRIVLITTAADVTVAKLRHVGRVAGEHWTERVILEFI